MTAIQTISWIFLATALASSTKPTDINGISSVADGINHSIPTQKELQTSISWLINKGLILKQGKKYELTYEGKNEYEKALKDDKILMLIWKKIEMNFNLYKDI